MNLRPWMLLVLSGTFLLVACTKKDLSPPPLNPNPKEALHVRVTFDNPDDAKRYAVTMKAFYRTFGDCGYMDYFGALGGIYRSPKGTFDIPNESRDPQNAEFNVYLDRYNQKVCNWELALPYLRIEDTYTHRIAVPDWGIDDLTPGTSYRTVCQFQANEYLQDCFGRSPLKDLPHYSRIPITIHVAEDSSPRQVKRTG